MVRLTAKICIPAALLWLAAGVPVWSQDAPTLMPLDTVATDTDEDPGQADLDEAVIKRIEAKSEEELRNVATLLESSINKGLDEENQAFAEKMLGSVLLQRGQAMIEQMIRTRGRRQLDLLAETTRVLQSAVDNDPTLVEAYLLIARLNSLPGGDRALIAEATTSAIDLLNDDPRQQSGAYLLRATTQPDDESRLADLDAAIQANPKNAQALQLRAGLRLKAENVDGAIEDLNALLAIDPTNVQVAQDAINELSKLDRGDEAMSLITNSIEAQPSEGMYRLRAILHQNNGDADAALADLNKAYAMAPKDPLTLIQRAELSLMRDDLPTAKSDYKAAVELAPQIENIIGVIELRSRIALAENRLADAINDAELLVKRNPDELRYKRWLASIYSVDQRPRKAIDVLTGILENDPDNLAILRDRGDALLSVGDHAAAIDDYEAAVRVMGNFEKMDDVAADQIDLAAGLFNNLSWVMATSTVDSVRDGKRSLEYGVKAAELTDYKMPHILSTLAAAHAEAGDFEAARKWATKAVELAEAEGHDQLEQLKEELETYRNNQPYRELQEVEENKVPILSAEDLIDT